MKGCDGGAHQLELLSRIGDFLCKPVKGKGDKILGIRIFGAGRGVTDGVVVTVGNLFHRRRTRQGFGDLVHRLRRIIRAGHRFFRCSAKADRTGQQGN